MFGLRGAYFYLVAIQVTFIKFLKKIYFSSGLYNKSLISIIPIRNSYQPSGQSVALQSMSMNVPVIITETIGFWDKDIFKNNENIFFIEKNDVKKWTDKVNQIIENDQLTNQVISNSKDLIGQNYNTKFFYDNLKEIVFKN